jgi:hypothetical protein
MLEQIVIALPSQSVGHLALHPSPITSSCLRHEL